MKPQPFPRHGAPVNDIAAATRPKGGSFKKRFFAVLGILLVAGAVILLNLGLNDHQLRPPRLSSPAWIGHADGQPRVYYVTEEERAQRRPKGRFISYSVNYSLFKLHSRDARTGAVTGEHELGRLENAGDGPGIIGPHGNVLWMWNEGLVAMDLTTLKPVWSMEKLKQLNADLGGLLPVDRKYYKVLEKLNALAYKGADARFYRVDDVTGKIEVLDAAALLRHDGSGSGQAENAFNYLDTPGRPVLNLSLMGLAWESFTDEDKWYALLTEENRAKLYQSPSSRSGTSGEVSRQLYRGNFTWEDRPALGTERVLLDLDTVAPLNKERYLMGGFLVRHATDSVWRPEGGKDVLVIHKKLLGENTPWHLTRLKLDGTPAWTCSIGLADFKYVCDAQDTIIFTGFADRSEPTNNRPELFVMIDEKTGGARTANFHE